MVSAELKAFLATCDPGPIAAHARVAVTVDRIPAGSEQIGDTSMRSDKLWRMEAPIWSPPFLEFVLERHGQTVMGSTRATAYTWRVDTAKGIASIVGQKRRQAVPADKRLDVRPLAASLAEAIINGEADDRLKRTKDGGLRINIADIIPATNKQTTSSRRARFRRELVKLLAPQGWKELRPNVYRQT